MTAVLAMLVVLVLATGCGFAALKPQVVTTIFPTEDVVIATIVVDAVRDGSEDATKPVHSRSTERRMRAAALCSCPRGDTWSATS